MTSKRIIMPLSIVCIFTLLLSFSSTAIADDDDGNRLGKYRPDGTWVVESLYYGTVMTEVVNSLGRSGSSSVRMVLSDPTLGGLYPDAAPVQTPFVMEIHMTGRRTYEGSTLHYVRNNDGSIAFFWISKAIGRWIDKNTRVSSNLLYIYNGENVNLLGMAPNLGLDGMPIDETDIIGPLPDLAIHKRLDTVIPPLDPPADHFPLP